MCANLQNNCNIAKEILTFLDLLKLIMNNLLYKQIYQQAERERQMTATPEAQMEIATIVLRNDDFMRYMLGGPINAAQQIMLECIDYVAGRRYDHNGNEIPAHPKYQFKVRAAFKAVFKEWHDFHVRLKSAECLGIGLFRLSDMAADDRKRYGDITDAQLYDWWKSFGNEARRKAMPVVNALQHKIALSLERHGVAYPEHVAWAIVGDSVLQVAQCIFDGATESVHTTLPMFRLEYVRGEMYSAFSLKKVCEKYRYAIKQLEPKSVNTKLEDIEDKNIAMSFRQLKDAWLNPTAPFDAALFATEELGDEIFRTPGYQKKAMSEIQAMRSHVVSQTR